MPQFPPTPRDIRAIAATMQRCRKKSPVFFWSQYAVAEWFYRNPFGEEKGPIGGAQLLELIRRGEVKGNTEIRKDQSPWVYAYEVNGLWQAVGRPSVEFKCPHCGSTIAKPPTRCADCRKDVAKAVGHLVTHQKPKDQEHTWNGASGSQEKPKAPPLVG
jgi:phage FluMu protein Com